MIDTHQHNWELARFDYRWIPPGTILHHDYLPDEALAVMQTAGMSRCVLVEAGTNTFEETLWSLELARHYPHIAGVVGYVDLTADVPAQLAVVPAELRPWLKGVRIAVRPDDAHWSRLTKGFSSLAAEGLACDLLIGPGMLTVTAEMIAAHPETRFILDHFAGARLGAEHHAGWKAALAPLARQTNTVMKVSGYLTAADPQPLTASTLQQYLETALELFGAARLMYGSDWPVCLRGGSYHESVHLLKSVSGSLSASEQDDLWAGTAVRTYQLGA